MATLRRTPESRCDNCHITAISGPVRRLNRRRQAPRRLLPEEKTRLETILASIGVALLVLDGQGSVISFNDEYVRMFGDPMKDLTVAGLDGRRLPQEEQPRHRAAGGENFKTVFVVDGPDGTPRRWFEAMGSPLRPGEAATGRSGGILVISDITDRSVRQRQDQLLADAAHELRTPLTSLSGFLQLIEREMNSGVAPDPNHLQVAIEQTRRLRTLVDDLTDVSLAQSGQLKLRLQQLDLGELVDRTVEALRPAGEQGIDFKRPDRTILVEADAARLQQVFANLINNARAHGGTSKPIRIELEPSNSQAIVHVQDFGQGIPASDIPNLFLRFYQSGEERGRGSGLGLFIARELVVAHGGSIDVASVEGQGATFSVKLPLSQFHEAPPQTAEVMG